MILVVLPAKYLPKLRDMMNDNDTIVIHRNWDGRKQLSSRRWRHSQFYLLTGLQETVGEEDFLLLAGVRKETRQGRRDKVRGGHRLHEQSVVATDKTIITNTANK